MTTGASAALLRIRVGHAVLDASDATAIAAAVAASNSAERIEGLPDALNPGIIDPAKAAALLASLRGTAANTAAVLAGGALYLNAPALRIAATAPTTAASFAQPFRLEVQEVQGDTVLARATVAPDCDLARAQAAAARASMAAAEQAVTASERQNSGDSAALRALSDARARRYAIAQAWRENAAAMVECGDEVAAADLRAAERAARVTLVPPHTGMP